MDQAKVETNDLETMEKRNNPIPRVGKAGSSEMAGRIRGIR